MSYTRPPQDQVNATWQGAPEYTRPVFNQADATWQAVAGAPEDAIGALYAELPPPPITITLAATAATVTPAVLSAALPPPSLPLTLQASGEAITYTSLPPYTYPPITAVNASWEGRPVYTCPPWDQADASWTLSAEPPAPDVHVGTLLAELPLPPLPALTLQATERPTTPAPLLWARLPLVRPAPPTLVATGEIIATATATISLPAPSLPIGMQASAELVQSASASIQLPPPELPLLARIRERHHHATMAVALPPPQIAITLAATGDMVQNAAAAIALPLPALTPLQLGAAAHQEIDLPDRIEHDGITLRDTLAVSQRTRQQQGAPLQAGVIAQQQQMRPSRAGAAVRDTHGLIRAGGIRLDQQQMIRLLNRTAETIEQGSPISAGTDARQQEALRTRCRQSNREQQAIQIQLSQASPHAEAIRRRNRQHTRHQHGLPAWRSQSMATQNAIRTQTRQTADHQHGMHPLPGYWWPYRLDRCRPTVMSWHDAPVYTRPTGTADATWQGAPEYEYPVTFCRHQEYTWWPDYSTPEPEPPPGQIIIPIRRVYFVIPEIDVVRLPDNYPIAARNIQINLDADSHTWQCSATLVGRDALDAVQPDIQGQPVVLAIHINGHDWHMIIDDWTENTQFGRRAISLTAHGLTAELAEPWELPLTGTTDQGMTIQQALASLLPFGSGWGLTWATGMADWWVPAGAWSWSNQTPISAIHGAATGVGMVVVPGMASRTLHIQPRYPVAPWQYDSTEPDLIIPEAVITQHGRQNPAPTQANAVYVHGAEVGGVIGQVKRTGTAGDRLAATASHPLITHDQGARLLGTRILSGQHQQPAWRNLTMPLGGDIPLGGIGKLAHIDAGNRSQRAVINGVSVSADVSDRKVKVRQTLTLGERTDNRWAQFRNLIPGEPTQLGEIASIDASTGTAFVELLGGGTIRVRGDGQIGDQVYVRGGMIQGQAPQLPSYVIEV